MHATTSKSLVLSGFTTTLREPDFIDPYALTAVWIGEQAAVEVPLDLAYAGREGLAIIADTAGSRAMAGKQLADYGIALVPHSPDLAHPTFGHLDAASLTPAQHLASAWRMFVDALDADNIVQLGADVALAVGIDAHDPA